MKIYFKLNSIQFNSFIHITPYKEIRTPHMCRCVTFIFPNIPCRGHRDILTNSKQNKN